MPKASAPNAPWVAVWLSQHTTVVPGRVKPCSGPMTWTMPWRGSSMSKTSTPNSSQFVLRVSTWSRDSGSSMPRVRSVVGTLWSATASVASVRRTRRPASRRPSKRLGRKHLVQEMPVDVEEVDSVVLDVDEMAVPDLLEKGLWSSHAGVPEVTSESCSASWR